MFRLNTVEGNDEPAAQGAPGEDAPAAQGASGEDAQVAQVAEELVNLAARLGNETIRSVRAIFSNIFTAQEGLRTPKKKTTGQ